MIEPYPFLKSTPSALILLSSCEGRDARTLMASWAGIIRDTTPRIVAHLQTRTTFPAGVDNKSFSVLLPAGGPRFLRLECENPRLIPFWKGVLLKGEIRTFHEEEIRTHPV